ncbi:MAG: VOC family protein [Firmicutes bacterium]|nr:VOC family protein [Bacillota bacterium]
MSSTEIRKLGQVAVRVHDLPRAVAFYRDTLCLPFLFEAGSLAFFRCGEVRLMLSRPERPEFDHPGSTLYFQVDDIDAAHRALRERGVEFVDAPHLIARVGSTENWMTFFRDPEGNLLALMEEREV